MFTILRMSYHVFLFLILTLNTVHAQVPAAIAQRILENKKALQHFEYEFEMSELTTKTDPVKHTHGIVAFDGDRIFAHIVEKKGSEIYSEKIVGKNEYYSFFLSRVSPADPFVAEHIGKVHPKTEKFLGRMLLQTEYSPSFVYSVPNICLTESENSGELSNISESGSEYSFDWTVGLSGAANNQKKKCTFHIVLGSNKAYRMQRFDCKLDGVDAKGQVMYIGNSSIPTDFMLTVNRRNGINGTTYTSYISKCNVKKWECHSADYNEALFRVSRFGFPGPEGTPHAKHKVPIYVWYISIAGGAAAIMFLCGWLLKRRAKARVAAESTSAPLPTVKPK